MTQLRSVKHAAAFMPELQAQNPYTIVFTEPFRTLQMEIVLTKRIKGQLYYRIVSKTDGFKPLPTGSKKKKHRLPSSPHAWLIFQGHHLPIAVDSRQQWHISGRALYCFRTNDPDELRTTFLNKCLNCSVETLSQIVYYASHKDCTKADLFPPERILHNVRLYQTREILPGIYFGLCNQGCGNVFNDDHFLGSAYDYTCERHNYRVSIHDKSLCPEKPFNRAQYQSQERANEGLIFHTMRLHSLIQNREPQGS